ncbi:MAG: prolipoprotein diacylglyceryl transferase family protein, partial [Blastocatellia bacterium]
MKRLNDLFDALPRTRAGLLTHEVPAFRACGVTGFYIALITAFAGCLLTGRSLLVMACLNLVCAFAFYAYTYLRRWITGVEMLVLLEHVWFALACNALALWLLGEPVLAYMDILGVALCPFLAAGRFGCTLVGCCHGKPSAIGVVYDEQCARDGFGRHLVGVRLFPVPAMEAAGLILIGLIGLAALPFAPVGRVFAWFLLAYSIMRFGLEGLRGDRRPHLWGFSQARWMAMAETALALRLGAPAQRMPGAAIYALLALALIAAVYFRWRLDWRRQLFLPPHLAELQQAAQRNFPALPAYSPAPPVSHTTSQQVTMAISPAGAEQGHLAHISLSLPDRRSDLLTLCDLAALVFPGLRVDSAQF